MSHSALDHISISILFGHQAQIPVAEIQQVAAKALGRMFGVNIPPERLQIPIPTCDHYQDKEGDTVAGNTCITEGTAAHRQLAHEMIDRIFDRLEEERQGEDFGEKLFGGADERLHAQVDDADTDALLDILRGVDLGGGDGNEPTAR